MTTAQAVLRGFRVSWGEWTRRPQPPAARPPATVARLRCWTILRVPPADPGGPGGPVGRR